jgi:hypothetical protein
MQSRRHPAIASLEVRVDLADLGAPGSPRL